MSRVSHIRMYPTDWRSGCMGLTLEQEGLYIRICMFLAETGRRVPLDDTEAARMVNVQTRNYRRVLGELLRIGKISRHDNGYGNDRVEHERRQAEKAAGGKPSEPAEGEPEREADPRSERENRQTTAEVTANYSRSNSDITPLVAEIHQQNQHTLIEPKPVTNNIDAVVDARAMKLVLDEARPILRDGGMSAGLMGTSSEIHKWMIGGCDLEVDVLPMIRAAVARGETVNSWKFFTQSIVNARDNRLKPLPDATVGRATTATRQRPDNKPTLAGVFAQLMQSPAGAIP